MIGASLRMVMNLPLPPTERELDAAPIIAKTLACRRYVIAWSQWAALHSQFC